MMMIIFISLNNLNQWFPTCGPRAEIGPPDLKKWPSTS